MIWDSGFILRLFLCAIGAVLLVNVVSSLARRKMTESFALIWGVMALLCVIAGMLVRPVLLNSYISAIGMILIMMAVLCVIVSFLAPFVAFLNTIPNCVMGGVCMALYGFIAVSGLKMIQKVDLEENRNLFVVSVILIAGIGGLTLTFGKVTLTSVACALILGILANLMLKKSDKKDVQ